MTNRHFSVRMLLIVRFYNSLLSVHVSHRAKVMLNEWNERISLAASNMTQLVCASPEDIYYIEIEKLQLILKSTTTL